MKNEFKTDSSRYAIILAGGSGTRLWPLSRLSRPKQLLKLGGEFSLLQNTVKRLRKLIPDENIYIITNEDQRYEVIGQVYNIAACLADNVYAEPVGRNTLPAISWLTAEITKKSPKAVVGVFPSDQVIQKEENFYQAILKAEQGALTNNISLLGIIPTSPSTSYGYIHAADKSEVEDVLNVNKFVEKPDVETAKSYLEQGNYFWNGGIFVFVADFFMEVLKKYQPETFDLSVELSQMNSDLVTKEFYNQFPSLSIDYGLMEELQRLLVVPVDMGWTDLGGWDSMYHYMPKDSNDNAVSGDVLSLESQKNLLWSEDSNLAVFGIENLAVIQTRDATLVCPREKTEYLKAVTAELKIRKPEILENHSQVSRPWGGYVVLEEGPRFKIKKLTVNPGQKISLQLHDSRSEHWVVVCGKALVQIEDQETVLGANESTYIPMKTKHRLSNPYDDVLQVLEVQIGDYLGEDDIKRFDDIYLRHAK
jgi:mannose-1-phosphate guanylyltransferase / mannose-6-phosphate isomerase